MKKSKEDDMVFLWKWRKYLLLLATLVASVTYGAGLNPPGGVRSEELTADAPAPAPTPATRVGLGSPAPPVQYPNRMGDPVLRKTYAARYTTFFYCNAAAFMASLVIIMFLLDPRISGNPAGLTVLRSAMLLDLLALMAAFAAGSCRTVAGSAYVSALFAVVFVYVAVHVRLATSTCPLAIWLLGKPPEDSAAATPERLERLKERRKFLLLLSTFATPLTYGAGLAPPGGFWSKTEDMHRAGAPLLHDGQYKIRYHAFFYANATAFVASLAIIMLLMSSTLRDRLAKSYALSVCVLVELLGLLAAYVAGSCRRVDTTIYVVSLAGAVLLNILLQVAVAFFAMDMFRTWRRRVCDVLTCAKWPGPARFCCCWPEPVTSVVVPNSDELEESRSLLLLLATLAATVTYQAGLSPPGGVWPEDDKANRERTPGNPVLLDVHPQRYKAFYHCNTAAFVASLVVIIILQSRQLSSRGVFALKTAMILVLFGLMGAYAAGSCRDGTTTIYVSALAVAVFVYSIAKVMAYTAHGPSNAMQWVQDKLKSIADTLHLSYNEQGGQESEDERVDLARKRKFLMQLAILAATVTYQTGLNPPGGFWPKSGESDEGTWFNAGDPMLLDHYGIRYQVFFYCNATGFMASVAVILLLANQTLSKQGIRSKALHVCVLIGLLGLMGAYAAGSCRKLRTSIYVFALVAAVVTFLLLEILLYMFAGRVDWLKELFKTLSTGPAGDGSKDQNETSDKYKKHKYLILLGILAASVTYQAGLAPPGGTWGDDDEAASSPSPAPSPAAYLREAGNPILFNTNKERYQAFFYCNATSFVASVVVILLLLQRNMERRGAPLWAIQTAVVLDLLGLLGAYAAGSCRDWETSAYVIALVAVVVVFITLHVLLSIQVVMTKVRSLKVYQKCFRTTMATDQVSSNATGA